jgi:hypothetical protein
MKYRTVIEVICDAEGKDEATNIAGEYLRGQVDYGVEMNARTDLLWSHNVKKYALSTIIIAVMFLTMTVKIGPIGSLSENKADSSRAICNTYTIMPVLKTKHKSDFRKEWTQKKEEAVLDFLKN